MKHLVESLTGIWQQGLVKAEANNSYPWSEMNVQRLFDYLYHTDCAFLAIFGTH